MRVGIVGAGISGLSLHRELSQRGVASVVFEAESDPGGMIRTRHQDGRVLECGPQRTRLTPALADLVAATDSPDGVATGPIES
jgi:oxygen-dependent protoporphyrinogen oxidase